MRLTEFYQRIRENQIERYDILVDYWYVWVAMFILCTIFAVVNVNYKFRKIRKNRKKRRW